MPTLIIPELYTVLYGYIARKSDKFIFLLRVGSSRQRYTVTGMWLQRVWFSLIFGPYYILRLWPLKGFMAEIGYETTYTLGCTPIPKIPTGTPPPGNWCVMIKFC